jgi:leader peptidase (prepilin peptidase) / N-methyltransferase
MLTDIVLIEIILAFLAGLLIGSFLNVCVFRLPRDLSVVQPRSFCPGCEKTIAWHDNIPLASFVLLRGRCRHCGERIPLRYPLVELSTGLAFAICAAAFGGFTLLAAKFAIFAAILITLIATDIEERILPDEFTLGGIGLGIVLAAFVPMDPGIVHLLLGRYLPPAGLSIGEAVLGAAVSSGIIWLMAWLYERIRHREGMGLGDVKMIGMIGAFLGLPMALLTLIVASLLGAVGGLIFIFATRKQASTYELPFGSFLGLAALALAAYGKLAVTWYSHAGR